ncbi:Smr/MutS family protein [Treponema sp.]|uniref:Smr/MutS family protein n=1 Tax=Treponema sp. TaxID=166 RepID=UPI00298E504F|nr:Smr/MutS family protein [Treponema sp.]MCQ2241892.1 Smr/MutS family protein [Treponema sp.]
MNFGDILNQWEGSQKKQPQKKQPQVSHKKANAPTKEEKEAARQGYTWEQIMEQDSKRHMNPMEIWLNRHGTIDKDKISEEAARSEKLGNIDYLRSMNPEAVIDLHQLTRDEAWSRLQNFVNDCYRRNLKKILIIHGKGIHSNGSDPVLGPMVRMFIENDKRLGTSGHPDRNHGGNGATWVIIREKPKV